MKKKPIIWEELCPILVQINCFTKTDKLVLLVESENDLRKYRKIIERLKLHKSNGEQFCLSEKNAFFYNKLLCDCGFYINDQREIYHPDIGAIPNGYKEMTSDNSSGKAYEFVEHFAEYYAQNPYKNKIVFGIVDKDLGHNKIVTSDNFAKTEYRDIESTLLHEYLISVDDIYKSSRALWLAIEQGLLEQSSFELNCNNRCVNLISRFLWNKERGKGIDKKDRKENIQMQFGSSLYDINIKRYLENQKSSDDFYLNCLIDRLERIYISKKMSNLEVECEGWLDESGCDENFPSTACSLINGHMYFDALTCCKNITEETDNELFENWLDDEFLNINKIASVDPIKTFVTFLRNKGIIED